MNTAECPRIKGKCPLHKLYIGKAWLLLLGIKWYYYEYTGKDSKWQAFLAASTYFLRYVNHAERIECSAPKTRCNSLGSFQFSSCCNIYKHSNMVADDISILLNAKKLLYMQPRQVTQKAKTINLQKVRKDVDWKCCC